MAGKRDRGSIDMILYAINFDRIFKSLRDRYFIVKR